MKYIYYSIAYSVNVGTEENPNMEEVFTGKRITYTEDNLELAKREAHNGEYTIVDDGKPEPEPEPGPKPSEDDSVWDELDAAYQEGVDSV